MTINIISSYVLYKNKLGIGKNGKLLMYLKEDMQFFKHITTNCKSIDSKLDYNILLMGRKTWESIPIDKRPLQGRISFILTNDKKKLTSKIKLENNSENFVNLSQFFNIYKKYNPNVFVIGGEQIYKEFIDKADKLYLTEIKNYNINTFGEPDSFLKPPLECHKLIGFSEEYKNDKYNVSFRILHYRKFVGMKSQERLYLNLGKDILLTGKKRIDRTGVGTISKFATRIKYDISNELPLFTTKNVNFKNIIEELLWICRGDTNAKILDKKGVKIWNGNTSKEFLNSRNLDYPEGIAGPIYGWQLRFWNAPYSTSDTNVNGFDQLKYVEDLLKNDPMSRRILFNLWNPGQMNEMSLPPCFPAGTLVLTNNGYKEIEKVLITDKLFTHTGNWKNIIHLQQKNYNDNMFEFKLRYNSKPIKATKEHPFLVKNLLKNEKNHIIGFSEEPYWCNAENITKDNVICLPVNKNSIIPKFTQSGTTIENKDEWFMMGFFTGNGWLELNKRGTFSFCINKVKLDIYNRISKILHLTYNSTDKLVRYTCSNLSWWEILKEFGHLAHNKKIPEWIQDAPLEYIESFIDGYIAAEDQFTTVSADLAYGLQRLYAKLGKVLSISYKKNTYHMSIKKNIKNVDENYLYFNIIDINKKLENTQVYNFQVEDDNSYTVQNVSVHNCHFVYMWYVEEQPNGIKKLNAQLIMRSNDFFLAGCYNNVTIAVLTMILAKKCNMIPGEIVHIVNDCHIYCNHIEQFKKQLSRENDIRPLPKLLLNESIINKDWKDITFEDFDLIGYMPHPFLSAPMAV